MYRTLFTLSLAAATVTSSLAIAQQPVPPAQSQPAQSQRAENAQAGSQAQGLGLSAFIAHKLKRGNEAEVELGQLASERAKHDSVKEFGDMMVKAHTEMIQKLEQLDHGMSVGRGTNTNPAPGQAPGQTPANPNPASGNPNPVNPNGAGAIPQERRAGDNVRNSESNTSDDLRASDKRQQGGTSQSSSAAGAAPGTSSPNQATGQLGANQTQPGVAGQAGQAAHAAAGGMTGHVPQMLVALSDQTCDNELQLTKQMLEKHKGDDFDMAYIGQQIVAHTCMLAHLQAIKNSGPQELQQLATQGEQTTRKHLDQAMKVAQELGGKEKSSQ